MDAVTALLKTDPDDPYFLGREVQVLLESGLPKDAIPPLREAVARSHSAPLIAATLGHALIATEDPAHYPEAEKVLKTAVALDNENPRSEEHTTELQSLIRISYAVSCLTKTPCTYENRTQHKPHHKTDPDT